MGFYKNAIDAEIVLGLHTGMRVLFRFKRKQFQVRLSFATTSTRHRGKPSQMTVSCLELPPEETLRSPLSRRRTITSGASQGRLMGHTKKTSSTDKFS